MKLTLQRQIADSQGTTGQLLVNGEPFCFTLERAKGDPLHPCIPAGVFAVRLAWSDHFQRTMPHVEDVPGRTGIEIHWGNYVENVIGCIEVGSSRSTLPTGAPAVWNSRQTFDALYQQLQDAQTEGISIEVVDAVSGQKEAA